MNKEISIDVVIPSFRVDYAHLKRIIDLKASDPSTNIRFIIVVDNPDVPDEVIENLKRDNVTIFKNEENLGASGARNVGLDHSTGDYVLFLDDDIVPHKDLLNIYIESIHESPDVPGFIGVTQFPEAKTYFTKALKYSDILTFFDYAKKVKTMSWGVTANLMLKREDIGDTRFDRKTFPKKGGGEDIDFCLNIVEKTGKMFPTVPNAVVTHPWWNSGKFHLNRFFRWAYGDSALPRLHPKYKYYNFPNLVEFLILASPFILLFNRFLSPLWLLSVIFAEFMIEFMRIMVIHKKFINPVIAFYSFLIRSSNDLGRFLGYIKNRMLPFFQRFDYFTTGISISYERKLAVLKVIIYITITFIFLISFS